MTVLTTIPNGASYKDIRDTLNSVLTRLLALDQGGSTTPTPTPTPTPAPTPTPSATTLAQQSAIVARWSAASLMSQADGSPVTAWPSIVGSDTATQADATKQPKFYKSGVGGKPYVKFDGSNFLAFLLSGPAGVAIASGNFTVQIVFQTVTNTSLYGYFFNAGGYNDFSLIIPTGSTPETGSYNGGGTMLPVDDLLFQTVGATKGSPYGNRSMSKSSMSGPGIIANGSGSGTGYIGGNPGFGLAGAEVSEIIVWNKFFEQPDETQFVKWAYEQHQQPYPWATAGFQLWDGNSTFAGYGSGPSNGTSTVIPYRVAKKKGRKLGTFTFIGASGRSLQSMVDQAPARIDPLVALLAPTPLTIVAGEYANMGYAPINELNALVAKWNTDRKAAGAGTVIYVTSSDVADNSTTYGGDPTRRAAYNNFCTNLSSSKADRVITLHLDTKFGVEGSCPNIPGPYGTYFIDEVHGSEAGYEASATYMAASSALT